MKSETRVFDHLFRCVYNDDHRRREVSRSPMCGSPLSRRWHVTRDTLTWHSSLYKYCHIPWLNWVLTHGLKTSHNPLWSEYARPRNTLLFSAGSHSDYCQPWVPVRGWYIAHGQESRIYACSVINVRISTGAFKYFFISQTCIACACSFLKCVEYCH